MFGRLFVWLFGFVVFAVSYSLMESSYATPTDTYVPKEWLLFAVSAVIAFGSMWALFLVISAWKACRIRS